MKKRVAKTAAAGGLGFLAGLLLERGLESLTGMDFVDGVFAVDVYKRQPWRPVQTLRLPS